MWQWLAREVAVLQRTGAGVGLIRISDTCQCAIKCAAKVGLGVFPMHFIHCYFCSLPSVSKLSFFTLCIMSKSPQVSSLFGPGAFAGWLCTTASVIISWIFNQRIRERDTIGNDFLASLLYPGIAVMHFHYNLQKHAAKNRELALDALDAALNVVCWFCTTGTCLLAVSLLHNQRKRNLCSAIILVSCLSAILTVPRWDGSAPMLPTMASLGYVSASMLLIPMLFCIVYPCIACNFQYREFLVRQRAHDAGNVVLITNVMVFLSLVVSCLARGPKPIDNDAQFRVVPLTGYSIAELDQAVALGAGILTVGCTIYDAIQSRKRLPWEEYQILRSYCESLIEAGSLGAGETADYVEKLRIMAEQEEQLLGSSVNMLTVLQQKQDEEREKAIEEALRAAGIL